ncbi:MAG: hypothetical protein IKB81_01110 [Paludibacteraceae bacterium]|nr:hypothetical protein [Paludibacteraceae bacterium]
MKRFFLLVYICLSCLIAQAQAVTDGVFVSGDIVSFSYDSDPWVQYDFRLYLEANSGGVRAPRVISDDCLWRMRIDQNGSSYYYSFQNLTTGYWLSVDNSSPQGAVNQGALALVADSTAAAAFRFANMVDSQKGSYWMGEIYYMATMHWGAILPLYVTLDFTVANWTPYTIHVEKWEKKGTGDAWAHFNPAKIEFTYDDVLKRDVRFVIEHTTDSYYQIVRRPNEEPLLQRTSIEVDPNQVKEVNVYWESTGANKSKETWLDPAHFSFDYPNLKYKCPETSRVMMTVGDAQEITAADGHKQWQFSLAPVGKSPMDLKGIIYPELDSQGNQLGILTWIDYSDNVVVEYKYGNQSFSKKMRVVRKSYHKEELNPISVSINPVTYTFREGGEAKDFVVNVTHQHGSVIYNVDGQEIVREVEGESEIISLRDAHWTFTFENGWEGLSSEVLSDGKMIRVSTPANESDSKRTATLVGTYSNQSDPEHKHAGEFRIPIAQRVEAGGIKFFTQAGEGATQAEKKDWDKDTSQQQVHTAERTIYYLPNQEIELRLPESGYSGYMRWYDYKTKGDPYYNENPVDFTDWIRSPRSADGTPFAAINTPQSAETAHDEGISYGLYSFNRNNDRYGAQTAGTDANYGGVLNENNTNNPAPILKGWNYTYNASASTPEEKAASGYHTMACDVSAYTDYGYTLQNGQITSITEPTLSYRQIFHLKPAEEMADTLSARTGRKKYLETYKYQAPSGKQILLSTEYRYVKYRSHPSEMCYFYRDASNNVQRIPASAFSWTKEVWDNSTQKYLPEQPYTPTYTAELDYLIVRSDNYTMGEQQVKHMYRLTATPANSERLLIAEFEVEFVDIEKCGPTPQTIITQARINNQFKVLSSSINFDDNNDTHLPWNQISYGYVYAKDKLAQEAYFRRGATQGAFPFYGEYTILSSVNKDWARASAHSGKALYVDGTMEPGLVASIATGEPICSGQTMYCSAWFCNPAPANWSGQGNPIFRFNIQGKNKGEEEWQNVGVYFVGELLKGTGWQQINFPIESASGYDSTRVSIYNFATTNQGNDFLVDDITLYVSPLPMAAYHGKMTCRSTNDGNSSAAAVLRLDYSNMHMGSDAYIYYQIYNDTEDEALDPTYQEGDKEKSIYYHDYDEDHHVGSDHKYGSVRIPSADYVPSEANGDIIYQSVTKMLDEMGDAVHKKAYVETKNAGEEGVSKYLLYVAHIIENTEDEGEALKKLYNENSYIMRMAYSVEELDEDNCNMQTPLHATQQTLFDLRNSSQDLVGSEFIEESLDNCANDLYYLTVVVKNTFANEVGGALQDKKVPIYADWLVGIESDDVFGDDDAEPADQLAADEAFKSFYKYTHGQVTAAIMYDMRRPSTADDPNPNYYATRFEDLKVDAFESRQNYDIVKHLYDNGWLQMYDTTINFYLGSDAAARYWCFPIEGTATMKVNYQGKDTTVVLKDCNEPRWVKVTSKASTRYINISPIELNNATAQQKTELPIYKIVVGDMSSIKIPVTDIGEDTKIANCEITEENGKKYFTLNTDAISIVDLETGEVLPVDPNKTIEAGREYIARLQLTTGADGVDLGSGCKGYIFLKIQVLPQTLVWRPADTKINGWGLNDNWKSWEDTNGNNVVDNEDTFGVGYVPMAGVDVIIPKIDNELRYPYIVPDNEHLDNPNSDHKHNHYPLTINHDVHTCRNIYFAPGAKIHNQHLLEYENAFVDMQITAGGWNMVSAPMKGMVSGDMFIPHSGMYYDNNASKIEEPNPFEVSDFQGTRSTNAVYAFWEGFYNTTVEKMTNNGLVNQTASAEFISSNTLAKPLTPGTGYHLWGEGKMSQEALTIRLPKPDTKYDYYTREQPNGESVDIPQEFLNVRGKLAFDSDHEKENDPMTITLTNAVSSQYFLFGNPTMAYIDMHALFVDNSTSNWTGSFQRMENSILMSIAQLTMAEDRYLPPMTSALLECSEAKTSMTIQLKPSHLTLNNLINPTKQADGDNTNSQSISARRVAAYESERPENEDAQATEMLTIYALTENAHARTVLATNPIANDYYQVGEDALFISTGVENQSVVTSPLNMYTVAEQVPMMADVRQGISEIPLAILAADKARAEHMQMAFYLTSNWSRECYFYDSQTGQRIRIMDGLVITIEMPQNHEQRYYIEGPDVYQGSSQGGVTTSTPANNTTTNPNLRAYSLHQGEVTVTASELMTGVKLYDIAGRLLAHETFDLLQNTATLSAPAGVCVVEAVLRDGTTLHTQTIVR